MRFPTVTKRRTRSGKKYDVRAPGLSAEKCYCGSGKPRNHCCGIVVTSCSSEWKAEKVLSLLGR